MTFRRLALSGLPVLLAGMLLAWGCAPEFDFMPDLFDAPQAEVSGPVEKPVLLFTSEGGQASVVFHCNRRWSASMVNERASQWLSLPSTEGRGGTVTVFVRVQPNQDYDERSASILFTCDDVTRTLVVTQKQKDALFLQSNRVDVPSDGGSFEMEFSTNVDYQVAVAPDAQSWIKHVSTKGLTSHKARFEVQANTTLEPRQGNVEVTSSIGKEVLTVYQAGETPTLVLGDHEYSLPAEGGDITLRVTSNLDVSLSISGDWIHEIATKTVSTNEYHFKVDRNTDRKERTASIVFSDKTFRMSDSVRVHQDCVRILSDDAVSPMEVPSRGVMLSLLTEGGVPEDFSASSSASWLKFEGIVEDSATGSCLVCFKTLPNTDKKARSCKLHVYRKGYDLPEEIVVDQPSAQPYFSFSTSGTEVSTPSFVQGNRTFIIWGDGSWEALDFVGKDSVWKHRYTDGEPRHTVVIESSLIPLIKMSELEDGMQFDFSTLKKAK